MKKLSTKMKRLIAIILAVVVCAGAVAAVLLVRKGSNVTYVGICQLVQHEALDAATKGFRDALTELMGDKVKFKEENASGDNATCNIIINTLISEKVDLIMANATPALQAAHAGTGTIPILGTSVTDYSTALGITPWTGATGINISGTSDLAPLDGQAAMIKELFPDAKKVGILYCSAEANSVFQMEAITVYLKELGYECENFAFADSNDVASVTADACGKVDVLYIPTDNTAASCTEAIRNVVEPARMPVVVGEEGLCAGCGVASLSPSYYDLGYATGKMAYEVLAKGADVSTMQIQYAPAFTKCYNPEMCELLGVAIPDDYIAISK